MNELLLSRASREALEQFVAKPAHAVLLVAPNGSGKGTAAEYLAARLLGADLDRLAFSAHFRRLAAQPGKAILIEQIRAVAHFLTLRSTNMAATARVVLIEHAGDMTTQAQNALLKTIEEPPAGTVLILTAASELDILPTVRSRVQLLHLSPPTSDAVRDYFSHQGFSASAIDKALLMSDGLLGLTHALLTHDNDHPLVVAAARARELLQKSAFDRLLQLDDVTKDKQAWLDTLTILSRIAEINLQKPTMTPVAARKWHQLLRASHEAELQTSSSAQIKLVGLNFLLSL